MILICNLINKKTKFSETKVMYNKWDHSIQMGSHGTDDLTV